MHTHVIFIIMMISANFSIRHCIWEFSLTSGNFHWVVASSQGHTVLLIWSIIQGFPLLWILYGSSTTILVTNENQTETSILLQKCIDIPKCRNTDSLSYYSTNILQYISTFLEGIQLKTYPKKASLLFAISDMWS